MVAKEEIIFLLQEIENPRLDIFARERLKQKLKGHLESINNLDLSGCHIGTEGGSALAEALERNESITRLNLAENDIKNKGALALAEALRGNTTIIELNIAGNNIQPEGVSAIANVLQVSNTLISLDLSDNRAGNRGTIELAKALKKNKTLAKLNLAGNDIEDVEGMEDIAVIELAESLKSNKTLISLDISNNGFGNNGARALADALTVNKTLQGLFLDEGSIEPSIVEAIETSLISNIESYTDESLQIGSRKVVAKSFRLPLSPPQTGRLLPPSPKPSPNPKASPALQDGTGRPDECRTS